jgi:hypothetical protein
MNDAVRPRGFHLLDLSALVVGYGMASLLIRAFWPSGEQPTIVEIAAIGLVYLWLGLAMSGPVVLLIRRQHPAADTDPVERQGPGPGPEARTWAELAWLIIGFYWIVLTVLVVPVRLQRSPLFDATWIGLIPVAAALVLRFLHRPSRRSPPERDSRHWTHHAAVGLLLTWPLAWIALILLGKSLL